jgi:hypothetical protein
VDVLALAAAVGTALLVSAGPSATPGADPISCDGVAVAVDGGALDAGALDGGAPDSVSPGVVSVLGCADVDVTVTAHDAATVAGVELEGTQQWGAAFVCRVDGRPAVDEEVLRSDGSLATEPCLRTPSQGAYWSLWTSSGGSAWVYADRGATTLEVAPGDAVGLVFVTSGQPEPPRVAPAEALAGLAPSGWGTDGGSTASGTILDKTSEPVDGATGATDAAEGSAAPDAGGGHDDADGTGDPGGVALVGLGLAVGLLVLAVLRARARRP